MARVDSDQELRPSILDRLIDREPRVSSEAPAQQSQHLARIKDGVKRDLEWLLNSRQPPVEWPDDMRQLAQSVLTYGLPDFTTSTLASPKDQDQLRRIVEETIARFEPRLSAVQVTIVEGREFDRTLRFRIDAMLRVEPSPLPVSFDSVFQLNSRAFVVQGEGS